MNDVSGAALFVPIYDEVLRHFLMMARVKYMLITVYRFFEIYEKDIHTI
jgi:hypothetical protein